MFSERPSVTFAMHRVHKYGGEKYIVFNTSNPYYNTVVNIPRLPVPGYSREQLILRAAKDLRLDSVILYNKLNLDQIVDADNRRVYVREATDRDVAKLVEFHSTKYMVENRVVLIDSYGLPRTASQANPIINSHNTELANDAARLSPNDTYMRTLSKVGSTIRMANSIAYDSARTATITVRGTYINTSPSIVRDLLEIEDDGRVTVKIRYHVDQLRRLVAVMFNEQGYVTRAFVHTFNDDPSVLVANENVVNILNQMKESSFEGSDGAHRVYDVYKCHSVQDALCIGGIPPSVRITRTCYDTGSLVADGLLHGHRALGVMNLVIRGVSTGDLIQAVRTDATLNEAVGTDTREVDFFTRYQTWTTAPRIGTTVRMSVDDHIPEEWLVMDRRTLAAMPTIDFRRHDNVATDDDAETEYTGRLPRPLNMISDVEVVYEEDNDHWVVSSTLYGLYVTHSRVNSAIRNAARELDNKLSGMRA